MSNSFTTSNTQTFTLTHAKYLASKVVTDLKRIQRLYGSPSDSRISDYESELIELMKNGYLSEITYGFQKDNKWIEPTLRYTAKELLGMLNSDDDPGSIKPGADITGATFTSYLEKSASFYSLSSQAQQIFERTLPFSRNEAPTPEINGYISTDKSYSAGGKSLNRSSVKKY